MTGPPVPLFRYRHVVEHGDTDDSGVMHFARYPSLVETAVLRGLDAHRAGLHALRAAGTDLVVAELRMSYLAPARFLDQLEVAAAVEHAGMVQLRMSGTVSRAGQDGAEPVLLARGTLVLGVVDAQTGAVTKLPPAIQAMAGPMTGSEVRTR